MQLYFVHTFNKNKAIGDETDSRHLSKAMRKHVGDLVYITHGNGEIWQAEILKLGRRDVIFKPLRLIKTEIPSKRIAVAVAPTKSASRIEELVERGVELGLTDLYLVHTERTLRKGFRTNRLERLAVSAMKQCLRASITCIHEMMSYKTFLDEIAVQFPKRFIGKIEGDNKYLINEVLDDDTLLLIGPEGDFTDEEYSMAAASGFKPVKLSEQRLRTETAGIMAIATVQNNRNKK